MVLLFLFSVMVIFDFDVIGFAGIGKVALIAISITILTILLVPQLIAPVAVAFGKVVANVAPRYGKRLDGEISKGLTTLVLLSKRGIMIKLVACSLLAWLAEGFVFWYAALALSSMTTPSAGWLALPVGTLATLIPSTPGYLGTFDYFTIRSMTVLGNNLLTSTAYAILVHAMLWAPPTLLGGLYLLINPSIYTSKFKIFK